MTDLCPYAQRDAVLTGVKATPSGWPTAPEPGSRKDRNPQKFRSLQFQGIAGLAEPTR